MGIFDKAYDRVVLQPLADKLKRDAKAEADQNINKAAGGMAPVLRENLYWNGTNIETGRGRSRYGNSLDWKTLRRFSKQYDVARACINRRKRQLNSLDWGIVSADSDKELDSSKARELERTFQSIGGYKVRFREFIDKCVEDLLVLDALAIYKRPTVGGDLYSLQALDATTITLRVDETGNTPEPPEIAYKQFIRGEEVATFDADEMYYEMMNARTDSPYGFSPLESMILSVSTALRSQSANLALLTEGNIPEGYFGVPDSWSSDQIKEFQKIWDASVQGNAEAQSKIKFGPQGTYERFIKPEDMRYKEMQEWLMKTTCMMFEIPPQELGFTESVNRSTGEVQKDIGRDTGLIPLAKFFEEIFTDVVQTDLGYEGMKFEYKALDSKDEKRQAEVNEIRIRSGQTTIDEVRAEEGREKLGGGAAKPFISSGTPTFIDDESMKQKEDAAKSLATIAANGSTGAEEENDDATKATTAEKHIMLVDEMRKFRKFAIERKRAGKQIREFKSEVLPAATNNEMNARLQKAKTVADVRGVFKEYMQDYQIDFLASVTDLKRDLKKVL